jgi:ATP-dependent 26S proteasome regulatory subunit
VKRIRSVPLVVGQFSEMIDEHTAITGSTTGASLSLSLSLSNN